MNLLLRAFAHGWNTLDGIVREHIIGTVTHVKCADCRWNFELPPMDDEEFYEVMVAHTQEGCPGNFVLNVNQLWGLRKVKASIKVSELD